MSHQATSPDPPRSSLPPKTWHLLSVTSRDGLARGLAALPWEPALPGDRAMQAECRIQPEVITVSSTYSQTQRYTCPSRLSYGCSGSCNLACRAFKNLHPNAALMSGFSALLFLHLIQTVQICSARMIQCCPGSLEVLCLHLLFLRLFLLLFFLFSFSKAC